MTATIYHNPKCSTSRNALALARHAGLNPTIIEYLDSPPDKDTLRELIDASGLTVRDVIRRKEPIFAELSLSSEGITDDQLLGAIVQHPILLERPILITDQGVRLCRPLETALDILPPLPSDFIKENGDPLQRA